MSNKICTVIITIQYGIIRDVFISKETSTNLNQHWILDSGCTDHMSSNKTGLSNFKSKVTNVLIANNESIKTTGVGEIECKSATTNIVLKNVWHVPNLGRNLLSVSAITRAGYKVKFEGDIVKIMDSRNNAIVKGSLNATGFYRMDLEFIKKEAYMAATNNINIWHQRLGHLNYESLKIMGFKGEEKFCEPCQLAKSKKKPFNKLKEKTTNKLESIHIDLCGPMKTKGLYGETYFLAITDEATDFTTVQTFKTKQAGDIGASIKDYIVEMERQNDAKVKEIVMDGGKEFTNEKLTSWLTKQGIVINQTNPYTPEQNGIAERKNQTLVETARSMLRTAGMSDKFWSEAILVSAYTRNRCVNRKDKKTPFERFNGNPPNMENIKIFGSTAYSFIDKSKRTKWENKSRKAILIGYTNNGYKLLELKSNKIIYSRHVTFNELELGNGMENKYSEESESESEDEENDSNYEDSGSKVPEQEIETEPEPESNEKDVVMEEADQNEDETEDGIYKRTRGGIKRKRSIMQL